MEKIKRSISCLLVLSMLITFLPISVFAEVNESGRDMGETIEYNGHWYKLITDEMNWVEAEEYCRTIGGYLVTITSEGENSVVQSLISESTMIGLTDVLEEGVWTWVTGESVVYTNWARNEPNNEANEDYVLMRVDGTWNDGHLQKEDRVFVCEWDNAADIKLPNTEGSHNFTIQGLTIDKKFNNFYIFLGDSNVYNMDTPDAALYLDLNSITVMDDEITRNDIIWSSSDEHIFKVVSSGDVNDVFVNLRVEGLTEGTATLTATNLEGEEISFDVTVMKPNAFVFADSFDTKQYYTSGAFYSETSSISDSVEIFVQLENALIEGYPCKVEDELVGNISNIAPITLTATVSGTGMSFDRNTYQNTYTTTYEPLQFGDSIYDILMLFPVDVDSFEADVSYTVNLTLESDSFVEPKEKTYDFMVYNAEKQRVDTHIDFMSNDAYNISKQNIYGTNMLKLKGDPEYNWSVVTSLDFDNYYEIVLADILVKQLDVYQMNTSIVPTVLKDWYGTYKSLLGNVTTMVNDSYSDILNISEMEIDKVLKVSKYTKASDGIYVEDDVYQVVLDMFGNVGNVDKIQTIFAAVDNTKSAFSIVKLTGDVVSDFVAWGNSIAVLNAFVETDENFKQVFRQVADNIPDSDKKMKEAIEDYLNYSEDFAGQFAEIYESFCDLGVDVALDTFDGLVGKKLWDWAAAKALGWIGKIPLSGGTATFSSTAAYASLTTAIGSVTTGISLGLCLSDLICDSSDKATEMSKIIAMSEYAPYIIQALEYYEDNLCSAADNNAVDLFEKAFGLHQASQSYIMDHTVKALEVKAESILQRLLGNNDYKVLIADVLCDKELVDSMDCCGDPDEEAGNNAKKVITIQCAEDIYIYDENNIELARIIDNVVEHFADGLKIFSRDGKWYLAMPLNQIYEVKIVAEGDGTIAYGWILDNGKWYLYKNDMKISGWQQIDGVWYYFCDSGVMVTGWQSISGKWYYFSDSGAMQTGWVKLNGTWYYLSGSGAMQTGWLKLGNIWYYFYASGAMATGWVQVSGKWYYFVDTGVMVTGWKKIDNIWYYFQSGGAMLTGWLKLGNAWYYFYASGEMATGWTQVSGKWYYFADTGAMVTGWRKIGNIWYYFYSSGAMATGSVKIGYKTYNFASSGMCLNP